MKSGRFPGIGSGGLLGFRFSSKKVRPEHLADRDEKTSGNRDSDWYYNLLPPLIVAILSALFP